MLITHLCHYIKHNIVNNNNNNDDDDDDNKEEEETSSFMSKLHTYVPL